MQGSKKSIPFSDKKQRSYCCVKLSNNDNFNLNFNLTTLKSNYHNRLLNFIVCEGSNGSELFQMNRIFKHPFLPNPDMTCMQFPRNHFDGFVYLAATGSMSQHEMLSEQIIIGLLRSGSKLLSFSRVKTTIEQEYFSPQFQLNIQETTRSFQD